MNQINIDHRGKLVESLISQLPTVLSQYGDASIAMTAVNRTTLEFGDVEWESRRLWFVELKRSQDLIRSLISGHMQAQEQDLLDLPGEKALVVTGQMASDSDGNIFYSDDDPTWYGQGYGYDHDASIFIKHDYRYTAVVNYLSHLQERGITVVRCDYEKDIGRVIAGMYARSWKPVKDVERVIRKRQVSLTPQGNAVKALFPNLRLRGEQCDTIAQVAGVELGTGWIDECRDDKGKILVKNVQAMLPGVGRPTIKRMFGV